ncbi:hypothetical protein Golax_021165, partial [Gossypium laxum]|nr:hypothetical protein [Gossypium laxum]
MKIQNAERNEQPLVFEVAMKAMSMMEISKIHINNKPCCAVCKEQFCFVCCHELPANVDGNEGAEIDCVYSNLDEILVGRIRWTVVLAMEGCDKGFHGLTKVIKGGKED